MSTNVGIYARVSTIEQAEHGYSIGEQIERATKYCEGLGWTVFQVYTDAGISGASTDRPALQELLRDVRKGRISKVVVYKLDRLSRSQKDTLQLIEDEFLAHDVDFVSMSENFDTSTPFGRAMIGILAVFAQLEREQIKERMAMGRDARAKKGKYHGSGLKPIGYDYIDGELVVNDYESMLVRKIYQMYDSGMASYSIACELNEAGLIRGSSPWHRNTINRVLTNRGYLGEIKRHDKWYKGTHDPIIEPELFDRVQNRLKTVSEDAISHRRNSGRQTSILGGLIYCGECGQKYYKNTNVAHYKDRTTKYHYYRCLSQIRRKHSESVGRPYCANYSWRMDELDQVVLDEIRKLTLDPDYVPESEPEKEDGSIWIRKELDSIEAQISRLVDLYAIGTIDSEVIAEKTDALNSKKELLLKELKKSDKKRKPARDEVISLAGLVSDYLDSGESEKIQQIVSVLIERIEIHGRDVDIHWNF